MFNFNAITDLFKHFPEEPMLFNSGAFAVLFFVFMLIYALIYKNRTARMWYLFAFSCFFYFKSSGLYLILMILTIVKDHLLAHAIDNYSSKYIRKPLLIFSIISSLSALFYFKYFNFFLQNIANIQGVKFEALDIFLPIGISFYTFQTISYVVDVYKKEIKPVDSLLDYSFYMTFFPHLVAGPIVRAKDFLPQLKEKILPIKQENFDLGIIMIFKGLIKKAIIADYLAQYNDIVYGMPANYSGFENLMAMYGYAIQIYCDFSGYSDMAIGIAFVMGYYLKDNFNSPYTSLNITTFWRKWHISLSHWLRDYIYIPLGGNQKGELNQYLFLFITMLIGGFWHGADWKFVLWGAAHGIGLAIHKLYMKFFPPDKTKPTPIYSKVLSWFITFHFVAFLWIFFRASSFNEAIASIHHILFNMDFAYVEPFWKTRSLFIIILIFGFVIHLIPSKIKENIYIGVQNTPLFLKGFLFIVILQIIIQMKSATVQPFIYFQF